MRWPCLNRMPPGRVALGLCVSARTDNQVVSLIVTLVLGAALLLIGDESFTGLFGSGVAEVLRAIGIGSRFESVERGVIDLHDLAYYGGITLTALSVNVAFLELPRIDAGAHPRRAGARWLRIGLVGVNALLFTLWLAPVPGLRVDLTADRVYSLSPVTRRTLADLDEPLYIDAYLSDQTHRLLAPLLPRVRDTLVELDEVGGDRVRVTLADPATDDELAAEIGEVYGIESEAFGTVDRSSQSVVNAWFHVLVRYGDQHEVLTLDDLVEFDADLAQTDMEIRLTDLEYLLTRTIRRVSGSFQSTDAQLARLPEGSTATLYATPDTAPEPYQEGIRILREQARDLAERSGGRLIFEEVAPAPEDAASLYDQTGIRPLAADLFGEQIFYAHLVLESGDKVQRLMPGADVTTGDVTRSLEAAIRRASPGQLVTVGLYTATPEAPPTTPGMPPQMQPPPPRPDYQALRQVLLEGYEVVDVDLDSGDVPDHLDVLVLGKTGRRIIESSSGAWTQDGPPIEPDFETWPDAGFGQPAEATPARQPLAVTLTGPMRSWFAGRPSPVWDEATTAGDDTDVTGDGRTLTQAVPEARLAVVGSSDLVVRLAESVNGERHRGNLQLVQNLLDGSTEDTDLLEIRSAGAFARTLSPMSDALRTTWEVAAYAGGLLPLVVIAALPLVRRRRLPPELAALRDRTADPTTHAAKEAR